MRLRAIGALMLVVTWSVASRADEPVTPRVELRHDLRVDLPITGALVAATIGWHFFREGFEPDACRWCDRGKLDDVDDWFRRGLVRPDTKPADVTSDILAFGAAPLSGALMTVLAATTDRRSDEALTDVVIVAEGGFAAMLTSEILEPIVLRTRPYVHAISDDAERARETARDGALHSFPAGHVVETFGIAGASGVVATMRGYRLAPLVWATGLVLGFATAYTRIAADRSYFTDVLAGAAIGTAVGAAVPLLFHRPRARYSDDRAAPSLPSRLTLSATSSAQGKMLGVGGTW